MITNKLPRYVVIMESVQNLIQENNLKAGDQLPTEQDLINKFKVSRATVRQAMQELEIKGIVNKIHGVGTFVADKKMSIQMEGFFSFSEESKNNKEEKYETEILLFQKSKNIPAEIFNILEIDEMDDVIEIERLRKINGEPVLLEKTYIPAFYHKGKLKKNFDYNSIYDFVKELGVTKLQGYENLIPYMGTKEELAKLKLNKKIPLLKFTRLLKEKNPVEYSISILKPSKVEIQTKIERKL